jgi:hypothetical protein
MAVTVVLCDVMPLVWYMIINASEEPNASVFISRWGQPVSLKCT